MVLRSYFISSYGDDYSVIDFLALDVTEECEFEIQMAG